MNQYQRYLFLYDHNLAGVPFGGIPLLHRSNCDIKLSVLEAIWAQTGLPAIRVNFEYLNGFGVVKASLQGGDEVFFAASVDSAETLLH